MPGLRSSPMPALSYQKFVPARAGARVLQDGHLFVCVPCLWGESGLKLKVLASDPKVLYHSSNGSMTAYADNAADGSCLNACTRAKTLGELESYSYRTAARDHALRQT